METLFGFGIVFYFRLPQAHDNGVNVCLQRLGFGERDFWGSGVWVGPLISPYALGSPSLVMKNIVVTHVEPNLYLGACSTPIMCAVSTHPANCSGIKTRQSTECYGGMGAS